MQKLVDIDLVKFASHQGKRIHILEKNGILICLVISIIIGLYELYWFLGKGSGLGLILAVLSFVVSYTCFYLWKKKWKGN